MTPRKKTFLLFVPWMVPGGADRCGVDLLRHFKLKGWRTVVCSTRENVQGNLWRHEFARWADHVIDYSLEWRRGAHIEAIRSVVEQTRPRVVCINNSHEAHECIRLIRRVAPDCLISCLLHMNIPGPWDFPGRAARNAESYDRIICVSDNLNKSVRSRIANRALREKVKTLHWFPWWPPGKELDRDKVRAELGYADYDKVVLSPIRICAQKNPTMILAVAKLMPLAKFLIAGDGEDRPRIEAEAPPNVRFTGYIASEDMPRLIHACDSVFMPSKDEGIPLALMEAMACGVPVVTSDVGGSGELVIHRKTGALLPLPTTKDKEWATTIAESFRKKLVKKAEASVTGNGPFSFETWRTNVNTLLDDEGIQAAPMVRILRSTPIVKTFVIGCPKTGTSSVGAALEAMGCRVKGFDPVLQDYFHHGHEKPAFDQVSLYDAFADGPYNTGEFFRKLDMRFPGSRFVLTLRDEESWIKSHRAHFAPDGTNAMVKDRYRLLEYDDDQWLEWYTRRNNDIRRYFSDRKRLLLEVNVFSDPPEVLWKTLSEGIPGLRCPALDTPFPHINKTSHGAPVL